MKSKEFRPRRNFRAHLGTAPRRTANRPGSQRMARYKITDFLQSASAGRHAADGDRARSAAVSSCALASRRADSSKSVVHDDGRRKGPGPEAPEAGVFALRSLEEMVRWERGQPCPRELDPEPGTRGHGCPRSHLESALRQPDGFLKRTSKELVDQIFQEFLATALVRRGLDFLERVSL